MDTSLILFVADVAALTESKKKPGAVYLKETWEIYLQYVDLEIWTNAGMRNVYGDICNI